MPLYDKIFILTGAGLSAESGLGTFRDKEGIWSKYDPQDVATVEGYEANPERCLEFYNVRRNMQRDAEPNAAHKALAKLERHYPGDVRIITQNIDILHEAAGSQDVIHMHGRIDRAKCMHCGHSYELGYRAITVNSECVSCGEVGGQRPDVVWFGEIPYYLKEIEKELKEAFLFIAIGTSGSVYPAAGFVAMARKVGAHTVELNLESSDGVVQFHEAHQGKATELVPSYVDKLLHEADLAQKKVLA